MPCAFRPYAPAEPPVRGTDRGPSTILLARNLRDPATPYQGALRLREALGTRARMVVVGSGGHDAHVANGSACGGCGGDGLPGHRPPHRRGHPPPGRPAGAPDRPAVRAPGLRPPRVTAAGAGPGRAVAAGAEPPAVGRAVGERPARRGASPAGLRRAIRTWRICRRFVTWLGEHPPHARFSWT
ncbi:alpha/beta hydrolase [Kitasatospora sp. NPDC092286]|uniref:alpha/beta hydrolase n=1 Tax=Kitasatospora sp. NPDC092286 TaxID=3364087 RepID=UPI0037F415DC